MSNVVIQKTKQIWRGAAYAGLGAFVLLGCENAFAGYPYAANGTISGTITVHLNLPNGWIANNVAPGSGVQTLLTKGGVGEPGWTTPYSLTFSLNEFSQPVPTTQHVWVVFVYDQYGKRQGSFKYGAELHSACITKADVGGMNNGGALGIGPLYQNDGAVSFGGFSINPVTSTQTTWSAACTYNGYSTVNIDYSFLVK